MLISTGKAQEKLHVFGGLRAIMKLFITLVQQDDKKREGGGEKRDEKLELILCLVQAILAATTNNGNQSAKHCMHTSCVHYSLTGLVMYFRS